MGVDFHRIPGGSVLRGHQQAWQLTSPEPARDIQANLEHAFGGQCRIETGDKAADRVAKKQRLTPEQAGAHPDAPRAPIAHDAFSANVSGQGFVRDWYLEATGINAVAAPQIEYSAWPITLRDFDSARVGKLAESVPLVAGFGVRPKGHPERAKLVGTIDRAFIESDAPVPKDFDFAVWNAAWPDQQVDALRGDEQIELVNLCAPTTPCSTKDAAGNVTLTLNLPGHLPFALVRFENGSIGELEVRLDTVLIDPERREVSCVWRSNAGQATRRTSPRTAHGRAWRRRRDGVRDLARREGGARLITSGLVRTARSRRFQRRRPSTRHRSAAARPRCRTQ
ncbi:hypothetical protein DM992_39570 (plasmid) [Burkholderia sp. JP2-270]|uniref:DUF2169 domain-containing protein n=1 Tax=Burkholderia sp. JP2-270 TaxID=2217913 RepID=UPI000DA26AFE|nr:DUF2169 domain-containing protein [Burkholderia sp. JP2-270]AWV05431.1 hypothetical protein DM992_39570 [Burkholderia sp. JP2-270]